MRSLAGETLDRLIKRTGSSVDTNMASVINEIPDSQGLKDGEPVKMIISKPYQIK